MNEDGILRIGIMCRVSTDEQALHGDSLEAQETALVEYANTHNMKIYKIYRDAGFSARKAVLKRPAMLELLKDVKEGKLDMVIFTKLDRWFRNIQEYYKIQEILDKHKVTWKSILEDYSTTTADGRFKVNIMLSVNEQEADRTSERIKFVFQSKINKKEVILSPQCVPFGYKIETIDGIKRLVKNEETREIVELFFKTALVSSVRQSAIKTNQTFGINRAYSGWNKMCKNEIYTGKYRGVDDYCEPYITKVQQQSLTDRIVNLRKAKNNRIYLFSGLIKCNHCGQKKTGKYNINRYGTEYRYYRCPFILERSCDASTISEKEIEQYLIENIENEINNFILSAETKKTDKPRKKSDVTKLKEQLRRVNVSYQAGNMEDDEYLAKTKEIRAMIEKATAEEEVAPSIDLKNLKEFLNSGFKNIYITLTQEEKQKLWRSIISEILYENNKVVGIKFK